MKLSITIKGNLPSAYYFLDPINQIKQVKEIVAFRDAKGYALSKVKYITVPRLLHPIKIIYRFVQMISKGIFFKSDYYIGFYEVPHGFLAVIFSKIFRTKSIVCILSNPYYRKVRNKRRTKLMMWIVKNADYVTTTGLNSQQYFIDKGIDPAKLFVLPNSIDTNFFRPNSSTKKTYDLITLNRLSPEKNVKIFVDIVSILLKYFPNIKAAIAGSGPEKENIINYINHKGLNNYIDMLGFIEEETLPHFFNSGKVFIACSETEGFPRTLIESMSCGVPCVTSNVGDINNLIKNNENGYLIEEYTNAYNYIDDIKSLLNNLVLYKKLSKTIRENIETNYSHKVAKQIWTELFNVNPDM